MERIVFKSIGQENIRYVWDKNSSAADNTGFYSNCSAYVSSSAFQYDTLGDGDTQHTYPSLVLRDDIEDYACSLALYIADNPTMDTYRILERSVRLNSVSKGIVHFLMNLKPSGNGKSVYFNLNECKKSTRSNLEYDTRWEYLPDDYEGNFMTIYNMVVPSFYGFLDRLFVVEEIRKHGDYNLWLDYEKDFGLDRSSSQVFTAMNIIKAFYEGMQKLDYVQRSIDCMKRNLDLNNGD